MVIKRIVQLILTFNISLLLSAALFGQAGPAVRAGSREALILERDSRQRAIEREIAERERRKKWMASAKLKFNPSDRDPSEPHDQDQCLDPQELVDGDVGYLDYWLFRVADIVGSKEMFLDSDRVQSPPICLVGAPTSGLTNDQTVVVSGLVEVKGTKTYNTITGSRNTIRIVRFVSPEREAVINAEREAQAKAEREAAEELLYRIWTSSRGNYQIEAKFMKFEKSKVILQKRDGSVIKISPNDLSKEDRKFYRELVKRERDPSYDLYKKLSPN